MSTSYVHARPASQHTDANPVDDKSATDTEHAHGKKENLNKKETKTKTKAKGKKKVRKHWRFSDAQLDAFENSEVYRLIDAVAHDHPDVVRHVTLNSHRESSSDTDVKPVSLDSSNEFIEKAFKGLKDYPQKKA